jgi:SAM-dependent methyltransferase
MDAFDRGARFYELFSNAPGRLNREAPLLRRILDSCPGNRVADLACRTGLHALFFAELGAQVHAYDLNPGMIEHAKKSRLHPNILYAVHDMREPVNDSFDLIVCLGNSLSLLGSPQDLANTFDAVHAALATGGKFIAQVVNYALPSNQKSRCRVEERIDDDANVVAVKCLAPHRDRTYLTLTYFVGSDARTETVSESATLAHLGREDLAAAAETAGLTVIETLGGFDGQPFDPSQSSDLILVCDRPSD